MLFFEWQLLQIKSFEISFPVLMDPVSGLFLRAVCAISASVIAFSLDYIAKEKFFLRFHLLVLSFIASIILLISSPNLIRILIGWDGLGVTSYLLVIYFQNSKASNAGILTILRNRVGDVLILITVGFSVYPGKWRFDFFGAQYGYRLKLIILLLIVAACTKRAQIPFSAWLPAAIAAPTPVSALVHSSTLVTAGVFLLIRFSKHIALLGLRKWVIIIGSSTIIIAGLSAIVEIDIKKVVALSTLSQLGLIISTLGFSLYKVAFFHLVSHAFFKALLFISVGRIIHLSRSYQDLRYTALPACSSSSTLSFSIAANLSLCGVPFLRGFYSKDLILELGILSPMPILFQLTFFLAIALTAAYTFRFIFLTVWRKRELSRTPWSSDLTPILPFRIALLWCLSLFGGSALLWLLFPTVELILVPKEIKFLTLGSLRIGGVFGVMCACAVFLKPTPSLEFSFLQIWSMPKFSSRLLAKPVLQASDFLRSSADLFWIPIISMAPFASALSFQRLRDLIINKKVLTLLILSTFSIGFISLLYLRDLDSSTPKDSNSLMLNTIHMFKFLQPPNLLIKQSLLRPTLRSFVY